MYLLETASEATTNSTASMLTPLLMLAVMFAIMYFLIIRPQKKREREATAMRNALQVGDEVVTTGGIIGRVVVLKDDYIVIETGSDRSKVRVKRWAIQSNTPMDDESSSKS